MGKLKLHVISHTHWDREWYQTFQNYRYRLVRMNLFESRSDVADGWYWIPVTYDSAVWGNNCLEHFSVVADGPLCTVWKLTYALRIPSGRTQDNKNRGSVDELQRVTTWLAVAKGSRQLLFKTEVDNHIYNHRLRVVFPTHLRTESFYTRTPFDLTEWPVKAPDTHDYVEADTLVHPSQGITFLNDGSRRFALYTKGLYEVEVIDNAERALAVTLFRASQNEAGTVNPEDIKMQRRMEFEYAVSFAQNSKTDVMVEGEDYRAGTRSYAFEQNAEADVLDNCGGMLEVAGDGVVSAVFEEAEFDGNVVKVKCGHNKIVTIGVLV